MRIVIQCAGQKQPTAGTFQVNGRRVKFVAHPELSPRESRSLFAHPDDRIPSGHMSWRQRLVAYNVSAQNPDQLLQAADLYRPRIYSQLVQKFGRQKFYILSAGWGLVKSDYLLPDYDITFAAAEPWKIRADRDPFHDFNDLANDASLQADECIIFFGTPTYFELFRRVTRHVPAKKLTWHRIESTTNPGFDRPRKIQLDGDNFCRLAFRTTARTNWHYQCADAFVQNPLELP